MEIFSPELQSAATRLINLAFWVVLIKTALGLLSGLCSLISDYTKYLADKYSIDNENDDDNDDNNVITNPWK